MKPHKHMLVMLIGLMLVAFAAGMAQTTPQGDQKKKAEACCSMDSCCCKGESSPVMKEDGATGAEAKHSCCGGDSCEIAEGGEMKSHVDHKGCCGGDESCEMKDMKHDAKMMKPDSKKHDMKNHDGKSCCKMKQKETKSKAVKKVA
jgi:hypothetical protein